MDLIVERVWEADCIRDRSGVSSWATQGEMYDAWWCGTFRRRGVGVPIVTRNRMVELVRLAMT